MSRFPGNWVRKQRIVDRGDAVFPAVSLRASPLDRPPVTASVKAYKLHSRPRSCRRPLWFSREPVGERNMCNR